MIVPQQKEKKPHIKKPLNAFMLFMKEKRAEVMKDCTLKESAAINQILGKMVKAFLYVFLPGCIVCSVDDSYKCIHVEIISLETMIAYLFNIP